jgi:DNA-binding NarL/FixJ family response regulator
LDEALAEASALAEIAGTEVLAGDEPLTRRELEVASLVALGMSNREIAQELSIAMSTAERHVANILAKLAVGSRTQIATCFLERHVASA